MPGGHARGAARLLCALVVILAAALAPATAVGATQNASAGAVSASFSYRGSVGPKISDEMLTIERSGQSVYSAPVTSKQCLKLCLPGSSHSVHVVNLEDGGEPAVVLDLFSGGASCCTVEQVFSYDPAANTYAKSEHDFGQTGDRLVDLGHNGFDEFLTADSSFVCTFTDCAASAAPIEILAFAEGKFTDITTHYRSLIAQDGAKWLKLYQHNMRDGLGLIAAWAADEDLLGHSARVQAYLAKQLAEHHLKGQPFVPSGQKFITALNRFLRKRGYLH